MFTFFNSLTISQLLIQIDRFYKQINDLRSFLTFTSYHFSQSVLQHPFQAIHVLNSISRQFLTQAFMREGFHKIFSNLRLLQVWDTFDPAKSTCAFSRLACWLEVLRFLGFFMVFGVFTSLELQSFWIFLVLALAERSLKGIR